MPLEALVKSCTGLPDKYVEMAVSYIHFLQSQYQQERASEPAKKTAGNGKPILRTPGMLKGKITVSDDFDAPLDDFKDYM